jgi:hypothetical protein
MKPPPVQIEKRSVLTLKPLQTPSITILSYNIAGDTANEAILALRMRVLAKIIMAHLPDVVCLLEVSVAGYQVLQRLLNPRYLLFQVFIGEKDKAGEVLLCLREKTRIVDGTQPYYYDYSVGKGRIIGVELNLLAFERNMHILLTKLDDKAENADVRAAQFEVLSQVLDPIESALVVGDFNCYTPDEPVEGLLSELNLTDAWVKMGCPASLRNPNKNKEQRATRIYYKPAAELQVTKMAMLGTSVIKKINTPPAEHCGLMATLKSKK